MRNAQMHKCTNSELEKLLFGNLKYVEDDEQFWLKMRQDRHHE